MGKSPDAFRTISEVAEWLGTQAHVLRFWESKFTQVKPVKRAGGRRYYRPDDMLLLGGIKKLLHDDGMTIKGVQKLLREQGVRHVSALSQPLDDVMTAELDEVETPDAPSAEVVTLRAPEDDRPEGTPYAPADTPPPAEQTEESDTALPVGGEDPAPEDSPTPDTPTPDFTPPAPDTAAAGDHEDSASRADPEPAREEPPADFMPPEPDTVPTARPPEDHTVPDVPAAGTPQASDQTQATVGSPAAPESSPAPDAAPPVQSVAESAMPAEDDLTDAEGVLHVLGTVQRIAPENRAALRDLYDRLSRWRQAHEPRNGGDF
ncbi:DNA-binding transcriptional regulator, MerR family [Salinihabitans flavidus]|uniref:DNA-binding transcriptional regulator, MerR family n=1 Tax=Salinihabitans flavidus TaxID=569882 RepID=A0A1H8PPX6_9RHOB|nr:MerR family transcriptional regulator [Salinihabitans flavidus]SEO43767.1 DNA-binding transcriptional regulator, MerR family [Salinihabitans flavidus]